MKKLILSLFFCFVMCAVATAQDRVKPSELRAKTAQLTRIMAQQLKLNESEYIQLRTLNEERLVKTEQVAQQYKNDAVAKDTQLKEVEKDFDSKVAKMLSSSQLAAYRDFKENPPVSYTALINEEAGTSR